jgi:hypothetical protein
LLKNWKCSIFSFLSSASEKKRKKRITFKKEGRKRIFIAKRGKRGKRGGVGSQVITDEDFSSTIKLSIVLFLSSFSVYQKYSHACRLTLIIDDVKRLIIINARNGFKRLVGKDNICV